MNRHVPILLLASTLLEAQAPSPPAPLLLDFRQEVPGAEPKGIAPVVGVWTIARDGAKPVLLLDGSRWQSGQAAANVADKARGLYGERYAEFLDSVKAYAYFPYAVVPAVQDWRGGEIAVRFMGVAGRVDQGCGILFNLRPNGDYLTLRANCLENNLVLWQVVKGRRASVKWIRNTPTPSHQWHDLKLRVQGTRVEGYLDGKLWLEHTLAQPVSGRVGLWSKADSVMRIDSLGVSWR